MSSLSLSVTAWSHRGQVREKNDDHYLCGPFVEQETLCHLSLPLSSHSIEEHGFICAVADGMGGYAGGSLASQTVLETLSGFFYSEKLKEANPVEIQAAIEKGCEHARAALNSVLRRDPQLQEAGTTLAGLAVLPTGTALPFHVGDSRVLRASAGFVRALTVDHTPLADQILSGQLSEKEAAQSPLATQLTRSFGLDDLSPIEWGESLTIALGDLFLLGTDGWHGLGRGLTNHVLREILNDFKGNDSDLVRYLVEQSVKHDGSDNATLVLLRVTTTDETESDETTAQPQETPEDAVSLP